jgi:hypothetical protein
MRFSRRTVRCDECSARGERGKSGANHPSRPHGRGASFASARAPMLASVHGCIQVRLQPDRLAIVLRGRSFCIRHGAPDFGAPFPRRDAVRRNRDGPRTATADESFGVAPASRDERAIRRAVEPICRGLIDTRRQDHVVAAASGGRDTRSPGRCAHRGIAPRCGAGNCRSVSPAAGRGQRHRTLKLSGREGATRPISGGTPHVCARVRIRRGARVSRLRQVSAGAAADDDASDA